MILVFQDSLGIPSPPAASSLASLISSLFPSILGAFCFSILKCILHLNQTGFILYSQGDLKLCKGSIFLRKEVRKKNKAGGGPRNKLRARETGKPAPVSPVLADDRPQPLGEMKGQGCPQENDKDAGWSCSHRSCCCPSLRPFISGLPSRLPDPGRVAAWQCDLSVPQPSLWRHRHESPLHRPC